MPPKYKFTKDEIISAAFELTRENGPENLTARAVAAKLGSSPKVIFGSFKNMDELRNEVINAAGKFASEQMFSAMKEGKYPPYKAAGMAYIQFARGESRLFRLLYMRDRSEDEISGNEEEERESCRPMTELIQKNTGLDEENAYLLHLEMWIFVHGIASMIATSFLKWDENFISRALTDSYSGLKHRFCEEIQKNGSSQNTESDEKI